MIMKVILGLLKIPKVIYYKIRSNLLNGEIYCIMMVFDLQTTPCSKKLRKMEHKKQLVFIFYASYNKKVIMLKSLKTNIWIENVLLNTNYAKEVNEHFILLLAKLVFF